MNGEYFVVRRGATAVRSETVHDKSLSLMALGLLMVMLSMPDGARLGYRAFLGRGHGEKAVRAAMRELEAGGYRWRFQTRNAGQIRTMTVVFDLPVSLDQAWESVRRIPGRDVESCLTESAAKTDTANRAESGAARSDKGKRAAGESGTQTGVSPSGTVQRSSEARCSVARYSVARSSAAQVPKGTSKEVLRTSLPDQTVAPASEEAGARGAHELGSGLDGVLAQQALEVCPADWELIESCLPAPMRALEASAVPQIANALRTRVDAGWRPSAIYRQLVGNRLPDDVRSLAGLVAHRIACVPVSPPKRSQPLRPADTPRQPPEQPLALRMRAQAREQGDPEAAKPLTWWFEKYPPCAGEGESA